MPTVDPALLAEQAHTLAADLRATYNAGEVKAQRAATLLDILADALAPPFKVGDRVRIARKVETDSKGNDCYWNAHKTDRVGEDGVVLRVDYADPGLEVQVYACHEAWWFSPEALDLLPAEDGQ